VPPFSLVVKEKSNTFLRNVTLQKMQSLYSLPLQIVFPHAKRSKLHIFSAVILGVNPFLVTIIFPCLKMSAFFVTSSFHWKCWPKEREISTFILS
jgi:hypothetical protein